MLHRIHLHTSESMFSEQRKHELSVFPIEVINKLVFKLFLHRTETNIYKVF
jgi:hypothetical protein